LAGHLLSVDSRPAAQHADISIVYRYAPGAYLCSKILVWKTTTVS
jgi:hypothetical protein